MGKVDIGGSVRDSVVVGGNKNVVGDGNKVAYTKQGAELGELLALLQDLRTGIAAAEIDADYKEMLTEDLNRAEGAAQKEKPKRLLVSGPIDAVKGTLEKILAAGGKVEKLVSMAQRLGELAARFGMAAGL